MKVSFIILYIITFFLHLHAFQPLIPEKRKKECFIFSWFSLGPISTAVQRVLLWMEVMLEYYHPVHRGYGAIAVNVSSPLA